jgi:hypothetical protein
MQPNGNFPPNYFCLCYWQVEISRDIFYLTNLAEMGKSDGWNAEHEI